MSPQGSREINDLAEFRAWVREFAGLLKGDEILLLSGPMAAGKTEFAKTLGALWGAQEIVSPTFALHNRLVTPRGPIDHFDLYRIASADELETTGLWEVLQESSLVLVEWPERAGDEAVWPRSRKRFEIRIVKQDNDARSVSWRGF